MLSCFDDTKLFNTTGAYTALSVKCSLLSVKAKGRAVYTRLAGAHAPPHKPQGAYDNQRQKCQINDARIKTVCAARIKVLGRFGAYRTTLRQQIAALHHQYHHQNCITFHNLLPILLRCKGTTIYNAVCTASDSMSMVAVAGCCALMSTVTVIMA